MNSNNDNRNVQEEIRHFESPLAEDNSMQWQYSSVFSNVPCAAVSRLSTNTDSDLVSIPVADQI